GRLPPQAGPRRPTALRRPGRGSRVRTFQHERQLPYHPPSGVVGAALPAHLAGYRAGPAELVFPNTIGQPLLRSTASEMWHRAATNAALPAWATFSRSQTVLRFAPHCPRLLDQGHPAAAWSQSVVETLDTQRSPLA